MTVDRETRLFRIVVGLVLVIPGIAGPVAGFLGVPTLARLLQAEPPTIPPSLHNSLRAVCWMFFALVPLVIWSLRAMKERAGAFQIIVACGFVAGLTRLTGTIVDGWPGPIPIGIMTIELGLMPVLLVWHRRLRAVA
jgi:hypothetical protein